MRDTAPHPEIEKRATPELPFVLVVRPHGCDACDEAKRILAASHLAGLYATWTTTRLRPGELLLWPPAGTPIPIPAEELPEVPLLVELASGLETSGLLAIAARLAPR